MMLTITIPQAITLAVLIGVVIALILDRGRPEIVALSGAAILLLAGAIRPREVQSAFASTAIIALASLLVISYAMERSGLLDLAVRGGVWLGRKAGTIGLWVVLMACGAVSALIVYRMGPYRYMDFVGFGLPLNQLTWAIGSIAIPV